MNATVCKPDNPLTACCAVSATMVSAGASDARELRRLLVRILADWGERDIADVAELLAAELLNNAVRHARTPDGERPQVTLTTVRLDDRLRVEVVDPDPRPPQARRAGEEDEAGRGLALVDALADQWGVCVRTGGKAVWFSFDRPN